MRTGFTSAVTTIQRPYWEVVTIQEETSTSFTLMTAEMRCNTLL